MQTKHKLNHSLFIFGLMIIKPILFTDIRIQPFIGKLALTAIIVLSAIAQVSAQGNNPAALDVKEFSFTPSTVDTTSSSATVTVTIRVTDTERDVTSIFVQFTSPTGSTQSVSVNLNSENRISGNARDGVYSKAVVFPQYSAAGTWTVNYISVNDGRNSRAFNTVQLAARGFATSLQVISNNQDIIAPEISEFSFTPSAIATRKGSQDITITFRAIDAISGVRDIYVSFYRPEDLNYECWEGEFCGYDVRITSTNRISGDAKDGVYRAVLTIPQNSPLGIYNAYVYAYDALGNVKSLGPTELIARGYPSQLRVNGTIPFDFDGDGKADISVFRPSNRTWYFQQSANGFTGFQFGDPTDKLVPADFDGDGKTDIAVYRDGAWYLQRSKDGFLAISFGYPTDIPMPADFDGDGKSELAVFRLSNGSGTWYVLNMATNVFNAIQFGTAGDIPVAADYDGDAKADYAVYRPSNGVWYMQQSTKGFYAVQFGSSLDRPVPADYDGDGKSDVAVYRPSEGTWYQLRSTLGFYAVQFGNSTDLPVPADYDGDGKTDVAVFRPSEGTWYQLRSTRGFNVVQFGANLDKPIPNAFVP